MKLHDYRTGGRHVGKRRGASHGANGRIYPTAEGSTGLKKREESTGAFGFLTRKGEGGGKTK